MEQPYMTIFLSFANRRCFVAPECSEILKFFVNTVLSEVLRSQIESIEQLTKEHLGVKVPQRPEVYSFFCRDKDGNKIILEFQAPGFPYFASRERYYQDFPVRNLVLSNQCDYGFNALYTVGILNFSLEESENADHYLQYNLSPILLDNSGKTKENFLIADIYLEVPKFDAADISRVNSRLEWWMYIFKNLPELEEVPDELKDNEIFCEFFKRADFGLVTMNEKPAYDQSMKNYRDMRSIIRTARLKGFAMGKAMALKERGFSVKEIEKQTGLSPEEIYNL